MSIFLTRRATELDPRIDRFLAQRVERNVAATLLAQLRGGRREPSEAIFAWGEGQGGELRFFAMRTPPWPLLVSEIAEDDADALMEHWLREDPQLAAVAGLPTAARAVAAAWRRRTAGSWTRRLREALHVLEQVIDPADPPRGWLRPASASDRALLVAWERDFVRDAGIGAHAAAQAELSVARRLEAGTQFIWEDGEPVSTLGVNAPVGGSVRIGPVFTPAQRRGHGYASAAVASACRQALADGAERCLLFTDLENPTSNKIYAALGFRRYCDWEELQLRPAPA